MESYVEWYDKCIELLVMIRDLRVRSILMAWLTSHAPITSTSLHHLSVTSSFHLPFFSTSTNILNIYSAIIRNKYLQHVHRGVNDIILKWRDLMRWCHVHVQQQVATLPERMLLSILSLLFYVNNVCCKGYCCIIILLCTRIWTIKILLLKFSQFKISNCLNGLQFRVRCLFTRLS